MRIGVLTGGGFLYRDAALQLYAGVMQLTLHERITLTAFGLVACLTIPLIWPRDSRCQSPPVGRSNTQNLRLDDPALRISV